MDKTPKSSKTNFYPFVELAIDSAAFIGSGIIANSYLTTWINGSANNGGIAFAAFLNANILALAYRLPGLAYRPGSLGKLIITILSISLSAFSAPYLVTPLANRFGLILSRQAAVQIACLNLAIKGSIYVLYLLGSHPIPLKIPNTISEVTDLARFNEKRYFEYFVAEKGKQEWKNLKTDIQLSFWNLFMRERISINLFSECPICWKDIKDQDFIDNERLIFRVFSGFHNFCTQEERTYIHQKYFTLNISPYPNMSLTKCFLKILSEKNPKEIYTFTLNQAKWAHMYFTTISSLPSSKEVVEAYFILFHRHNLKLSSDIRENYTGFSSLDLPLPKSTDEINQLSDIQVENYFRSTENINSWKRLTLTLQYALNCRFKLAVGKTWYLFPSSKNEIKDTSQEIIEELHEGEHIPYHWLHFSQDVQTILNGRFSEFELKTYPTFYQPPESIASLSMNSARHYF